MKLESAYDLEDQSLFTDSMVRTRASKLQSNCSTENVPESSGSTTTPTQENGPKFSQCNGLAVYSRNKKLKKQENKETVVETLNLVNPSGNLEAFVSKDGAGSEASGKAVIARESDVDLAGLVEVRVDESKGEAGLTDCEAVIVRCSNGSAVASRRSTRSSLKRKVDDTEEWDIALAGNEKENNNDEVKNELDTSTKKMELKMSKKIVLKGRPTTVKELFETSLLEGYPVFYNGGKKGIPLRGTIKDVGILCSCSLCEGFRVIPPCKFEIHACKSYRRASQYICFENGKSLLDVVKACRKTSFGTLEEMIRSIVGPLPMKEFIVCLNCKGSFLATDAAKVERLCDSCLIILKSEVSIPPTRARLRTSKQRLMSKPSGSSLPHILSGKKSQLKMMKKSSSSAIVSKSTGIPSIRVLSKNRSPGKILEKLSKSVGSSRSSKSSSISFSPQKRSQWKITKKDQRLHKLVFEDGGLPDGTEIAYYSRGKKLLEGYKRGSGICCRCCNSEVSPSTFEAHAGWASRRKPYQYIYTSNGVSLHELAISLLKGRKYAPKESDDLCIICSDGGNLILCDGCPRAFHKECASLQHIPHGKWYCKYCQSMFQREKFVEYNANAFAAGRPSGVDPIEQITKRCIRIVKNPEEAEVVACVLCRGYDFSRTGFGPRTVILCDQCEKEYHVGCLKKRKMADLKELPKGKWFCCMDCKRIYSALQNLLVSGAEKLPDSLLDVIRKKRDDDVSDSVTDFDVNWRLLSGRMASRETRLLLSEAVAIFHECFDPIVDLVTGRDFIPSLVYGRNIRGQDFGGMYCAILTVNSSVVSAGILRIFGEEMAELPLVATRKGNQGKGYFKLLFSCIEKFLASLHVRCIVLPAAEEAKSIWTKKFGFENILLDQLSNYKKNSWQMITFKGTSMLAKMVPQYEIVFQETAAFDVSGI